MAPVVVWGTMIALEVVPDRDLMSVGNSQSRTMTSEEQATLQRPQDVWRRTCGRRGYDAYSQECAYYVTQKTVEWRKDAGLW